ncbi:MAG: hypothetical protein A2V57_09705 [Candidatus Aminicenantes bacterium RBG_19FT_COMBO_65_30]|nr:MAG: hypothetical protein A2V57_09705 [Candidatus Aminicenantes bacterium RBG_19FT_COMBO_65_30]
MKKIIFVVLIVFIAGAGYYFLKKDNSPVGEDANKQYQNSDAGISFAYPKILTASTTDGIAVLHHDIPYKNSGPCDMMGDEIKYDRLTDFEMKIQIIDKDLTETVKTLSSYIPQENFVNDKLVASPGFIDPYTIADFSGFAIYEGAEGCGQTTYYFPIAGNKTLVIANASIQVLSGAIVQEKANEVLAVPGVISREKNKEIFESIVRNLKIN